MVYACELQSPPSSFSRSFMVAARQPRSYVAGLSAELAIVDRLDHDYNLT